MVHGRHRAGLTPMEEPGEKETQQPLDQRDWFGFAKSRRGETKGSVWEYFVEENHDGSTKLTLRKL